MVPTGYVRYNIKQSDDPDMCSDFCCDAEDEVDGYFVSQKESWVVFTSYMVM